MVELRADRSKASTVLSWEPKVTFKELVRIMVDADMEILGLNSAGYGKNVLEEKFGGWHRWGNAVLDPLNSVEGSASEL